MSYRKIALYIKHIVKRLKTIHKYNQALLWFTFLSPICIPFFIISINNEASVSFLILLFIAIFLINCIWVGFVYQLIKHIAQLTHIDNIGREQLQKITQERDQIQIDIRKIYSELMMCQVTIQQMQKSFIKVSTRLRSILEKILDPSPSTTFMEIKDLSTKIISTLDILERTN